MSGDLEFGQVVRYRAVVDSNEDPAGLCRVKAVAADRYGPEPVGWMEPMFPPYLQMGDEEGKGPAQGTELWGYEWPGRLTVDGAVLCSPLERILGMILDNLDDLNGHGHDAGTLVALNGAVTGATGAVNYAYSDARKDVDDGKLRSRFVRIATEVPVGEEA